MLVVIILIFYALVIGLDILLTDFKDVFRGDHWLIFFIFVFASFFGSFLNFLSFWSEALAITDRLMTTPAKILGTNMAIVRFCLVSIHGIS